MIDGVPHLVLGLLWQIIKVIILFIFLPFFFCCSGFLLLKRTCTDGGLLLVLSVLDWSFRQDQPPELPRTCPPVRG
jgi:hypothetical protein